MFHTLVAPEPYIHTNKNKYKNILWINAHDSYLMQKSLETFAEKMGIYVEELKEWFNRQNDWLIVFDNAKNFDEIKKQMPDSDNGHLLITSRSEHWPSHSIIRIGFFNEEEAIHFLQSFTHQNNLEAARGVAKLLGHVPTSLEKASELMLMKSINFPKYENYAINLLKQNETYLQARANLPHRNENFVGREEDLVALEETMSQGKPLVLAAEVGLGGIGKTQIALQYAYRKGIDYNLVWWINCESEITMFDSYSNLAEKLNIFLTDEEKKEENALIKRINVYLKAHPGWLLVYDDAQEQKDLEGLMPESGGHILITSRNPNWEERANVFKVGVFKTSESVDLIMKITGLYDQEKEASQLSEKLLNNLPLAVAQASHYIRETGISIKEYIEKFQEKHQILWNFEDPPKDLYKFTVNVTWNMSMDKIQQEEEKAANKSLAPYPIALPLMQICSFFASTGIPRDLLLLEWAKQTFSREEEVVSAGLDRALKLLGQYSMIALHEKKVDIHPLVQTVTKDQMKEEEQKSVCLKTINMMETVFCYDESSARELKKHKSLIEHSKSVVNFASEHNIKDDSIINIMRTIYRYLHYEGDFSAALKTCLDLLKVRDQLPKNDNNDKQKIIDLVQLIGIYNRMGKYQKTLSICDQILNMFELDIALLLQQTAKFSKQELVTLGDFLIQAPLFSVMLSHMGDAIKELENVHKAVFYYEGALALDVHFHGEEHRTVAESYCKLADAYLQLGDYTKSISYYNLSLDIVNKKFDTDYPSYSNILNNLGSAYNRNSQLNEARECYRKALGINLDLFGSEFHPNISANYHELATIYQKETKYDKAIINYEKSYEISKKIFESSNIKILPDLICLVSIYVERNQPPHDLDRAKKYAEEAIEICNLISSSYPDVGALISNLGGLYFKQNSFHTSLKYFKESFKLDKAYYGYEHEFTAIRLSNIGSAYRKLGKIEKGMKYYRKALDIENKVLDSDHPNIAIRLDKIGDTWIELGDINQAKVYFKNALSIAKKNPQQLFSLISSLNEKWS